MAISHEVEGIVILFASCISVLSTVSSCHNEDRKLDYKTLLSVHQIALVHQMSDVSLSSHP